MNPLSAIALTLSALYMPISGMLPSVVTDKIADLGEGVSKLVALHSFGCVDDSENKQSTERERNNDSDITLYCT